MLAALANLARVPASHRSSHALYGYAANANIVSCGTAQHLHYTQMSLGRHSKPNTVVLLARRPRCIALQSRHLQVAQVSHTGHCSVSSRTASQQPGLGMSPLHVRPRCLAARRHRLPRSSPQSATTTACCIDSLHRFARRLAASTRCILSLVKSPHRLALHWLTASQPWVGGEDGFCGGFEA